jgi:hypothetical protein
MDFIKHPHNWKAAKLLAAMHIDDVAQYKTFYENRGCFHRDGSFFWINLFPLRFRNTSHSNYTEKEGTACGLATKAEYERWCEEHRVVALKSWVRQCNPRMIVCTGIRDPYFRWFRMAFGTGGEALQDHVIGGKCLKTFPANDGKTIVAVTYFFGGTHGLNSDKQIYATGRHLADLVDRDVS